MSTTSMIASLAPAFTKKASGSDITYDFEKLKILCWDNKEKKMVSHIFLKKDIIERYHDDKVTIRIRNLRDESHIKGFIKKYGDCIQFDNYGAYILFRCNMTKGDLTDQMTSFPAYCFKEGRKGIHDIEVKFLKDFIL